MSYQNNLNSALFKLRSALANGLSGLLITEAEVGAILYYYDCDMKIITSAREFFENHPGDLFTSEQVIEELSWTILEELPE